MLLFILVVEESLVLNLSRVTLDDSSSLTVKGNLTVASGEITLDLGSNASKSAISIGGCAELDGALKVTLDNTNKTGNYEQPGIYCSC